MSIKLNRHKVIPLIVTGIIYTANPPWPIWTSGNVISFSLIILLFFLQKKKILSLPIYVYYLIFFLLVPVFILLPIFRGWHFSGIIYILAFLSMMATDKYYLNKAFDYITSVLAWIIIISLPLWIFHVFIHPLTPIKVIDLGAFKGVDKGVIMEIYGTFVAVRQLSEAFRFYSVFDEPGVLGTLSAFVLYGNRYDFRNWKVWTILVGGFFSFSMAFIILTILGFIITNIKNIKLLFKSFLFLFR